MFCIRAGRYSGSGIGRLGVGAVTILKEQIVIGANECPNCGCDKIKYYERTKGEITYIVYVCKNCKNVIRRELS